MINIIKYITDIFIRIIPRVILLIGPLLIYLCADICSAQTQAANILYRTDRNLNETTLSPRALSTTFGKQLSLGVDGSVYAQPIFVEKVHTERLGIVDMLYVATMNNSLYAIPIIKKGDRLTTFSKLAWSENLTKTGDIALPSRRCDGKGISLVSGNIGILSTPVIDRNRNTIYLVTSTYANPPINNGPCNGHVEFHLFAIDIRSGKFTHSPIDISTAANHAIEHRDDLKKFSFDPEVQLNRVSLVIADSHVIVAWTSLDDQLKYHGWVMSFPQQQLDSPDIFCTTCADNGHNQPLYGAAIWQSGRPPAVVKTINGEDVYFFTANGFTQGKEDPKKPTDPKVIPCTKGMKRPAGYYANALLKLEPRNGLNSNGSWVPNGQHGLVDDWCSIDQDDNDLGGSGPIYLDGFNKNSDIPKEFVVGGGKDGDLRIFEISTDKKSKAEEVDYICPDKGCDYKKRAKTQCLPDDDSWKVRDDHIMAGPIYWPDARLLFISRENQTVNSYRAPFDKNNAIQSLIIDEKTPSRAICGHPGAIMFLSAAGKDTTSGILWYTYALKNTDVDHSAKTESKQGVLVAFDAQKVHKPELWASNKKDKDELGCFAKFNPPLVIGGNVYVTSFPPSDCGLPSRAGFEKKGYVHIYGLNAPASPDIVDLGVPDHYDYRSH